MHIWSHSLGQIISSTNSEISGRRLKWANCDLVKTSLLVTSSWRHSKVGVFTYHINLKINIRIPKYFWQVVGDLDQTVNKRRNRCIWVSVRFECFSIIQLNDFFNYSRINCVRTTSDRTLSSSNLREMFKLFLG